LGYPKIDGRTKKQRVFSLLSLAKVRAEDTELETKRQTPGPKKSPHASLLQ